MLRQLLDSGIAPRYARRLAAELDDHRTDLEEEALRWAASPQEAAAEARQRLGDYAAIASEFAARRELKSWAYRSAWLVPVLRALARACLTGSRTLAGLAGHRGDLGRFAAATACGTVSTLGLLLLLHSALSPVASGSVNDTRPRPLPLALLPLRRPGPRNVGAAARLSVAARESRDSAVAERLAARARIDREPGGRPTGPPPVPRAPGRIRAAPALPAPRALLAFDPARSLRRSDSSRIGPRTEDGDLVLIARPTPVYPVLAARRGIEGRVVLEYTVTRAGTVAEVAVVESSNSVFNRAALEATSHFRYRPRVVHGRPVAVRGVRMTITFRLAA